MNCPTYISDYAFYFRDYETENPPDFRNDLNQNIESRRDANGSNLDIGHSILNCVRYDLRPDNFICNLIPHPSIEDKLAGNQL
jgi:hypothetical protein